MITKEEAVKLLQENDNAIIRQDDNWRYPQTGDDQRTCPMLDFMFQIEYKSGCLIFIPDKINKSKRGG